jgi:small-conductance mechanosensitive channel
MTDGRVDLFSHISQLYELALLHIYTWEFLAQAVGVIVAVFISRRLALTTNNIHDYGSTFIQKLKSNTVITFYELCLYIYLVALLWIEQSILASLKLDPWFVTIALVILAIWVLIRSSISLASYSAQTRVVTFVLWLLILISLFGNGSSTFDFLRSSNVSIAEFNISLMFIIEAGIIFTILLWLAQFLAELSKKQIHTAATLSPSYKVLYTKISRLVLFTFASVIGLTMLGIDITLLAVFSGALGLGLGIGLQRVFANFISGIILLLDKSIKPGDTLEVDGTRGVVDHMNARYVSVLTYDGKNILIPNESMVTEKVHNWSFETHKVQPHISFSVAFGTDLAHVKTLVEGILKKDTDILPTPEPSCMINDFTDIGVKFDIKYWVDVSSAQTNVIKHNILMGVWHSLKENNIEMAQTYPASAYPAVTGEPKKA